MRKIVALLLVVVFALAFSSVAFAASEIGMEKSPNFEMGPWGSWVNQNNPDVRFDTDTHRRAVPGKGGANANANSVVWKWHGASLVDPFRTFER